MPGRPHLKLVERRQDVRVPLVLRIESAQADLLGATENLSAGGLFIQTDQPLAPGTRVPLLVSFPGLLEAMQLEVEVTWRREAAEGVPAGVAVRIPAERAFDRAKLARLAESAAAAKAPERVYRLLLVEDNAQVEALYELALSRLRSNAPFDVTLEYARDGAEALDRLRRTPRIDLVVTDLYMPVMDGFTLLERMRADASLVTTPVLAISAGGPEARERAVELGVDVYLQKPVKIAVILETVRSLLNIAP